MKIFKYQKRHYLQLKDHTFEVLNQFSYNGVFWIQCTANNKYGIVKEYLPDGWMLTKKKYSGQMIYTLFRKNFFNYRTTAAKKGNMAFIAPTKDGAMYLMYKWMLSTNGFDDSDSNIEKLMDEEQYNISRSLYDSINSNVSREDAFHCYVLHCNDWRYDSIERDIKNALEKY